MYDFLYMFFLRYFEWKNDNDPKDSAVYGVMVAIFFHMFMVMSAIQFFSGENFLYSSFGEGRSKYFWAPFVLLIMFVVYKICKRRADAAYSKYSEVQFLSLRNIIVALVLTFGPLLLGIFFLNHR